MKQLKPVRAKPLLQNKAINGIDKKGKCGFLHFRTHFCNVEQDRKEIISSPRLSSYRNRTIDEDKSACWKLFNQRRVTFNK